MTECSNRGTCIRRTGECQCQEGFSGAACERLDCPSDPETGIECSGRGSCVSVELMGFHRRNVLGDPEPVEYSYHSQTNKSHHQLWDAQMLQGCSCDTYWYTDGIWTHNLSDPMGYDCSLQTCPFGDNPNRPKANMSQHQEFEMQSLACVATTGTFRIKFKGDLSNELAYNIGAVQLEDELQGMKTFGNISVAYTSATDSFCASAIGGNVVNVTFYSELGEQPLIKYDTTNLGGGSITVVQKVAGEKENHQCSNQGVCDHLTGACDCFNGYSSSDGNGNAGLRNDCGYFGISRSAQWGDASWYGMD